MHQGVNKPDLAPAAKLHLEVPGDDELVLKITKQKGPPFGGPLSNSAVRPEPAGTIERLFRNRRRFVLRCEFFRQGDQTPAVIRIGNPAKQLRKVQAFSQLVRIGQ